MLTPVQASDLQPGDQIQDHDWTLTVATAIEGDWTNGGGRRHHGIVVVTRQLGPNYPQHYALAEIVQVKRP